MLVLALGGCAAASGLLPAGCAPVLSGEYDRSLDHGDLTRTYKLRVPPAHDGRTERPLVIMLHGGSGSASNAAEHYGWREKADAEGFYAVFPDGVGALQTWNAVHCCGGSLRDGVDDVGFIVALIDEVARLVPIDRRRVYATGISNGGMLAHRLGAVRYDLIAAIAPVAATVGGQENASSPVVVPPVPAVPVPVIIFHGTDDRSVLYDGGATLSPLDPGRIDLSVAASTQFWVSANGCNPAPTVQTTGNITRQSFAPVGNTADVVAITVTGGGHAWPGGELPRPGADVPSTEISATDEIWSFFAAHSRP